MIEIKAPSPGESITEVIIQSWLKSDGDIIQKDEPLADIESDKATLSLYAEQTGKLKLLAKAGDTVKVGDTIATIDETATGANGAVKPETPKEEPKREEAPKAEAKPEPAAQPVESKDSYAKNVPSPSAQKLMDDKGVKPEDVEGSGRDGRVTKGDVLNAKPEVKPETKPQPAQPAAKPDAPKPAVQPAIHLLSGERTSQRTKMTNLRKTIAHRLVAVKNETAMLTTFNEVDMTAIMELRKKYKDRFKEVHEIGLGFMSFFTKACSAAIQSFPLVNGQIDPATDEFITFNYVDMGVAVSTDRGLMVPVVRNVESKGLAQIEKEIAVMAEKARTGHITIEDMSGGTFTITNGGVFGSLMSTPILNPPQSAILGMHKIEDRPIALNGQVVVRPMMYLALSYDHRLVDGRESVSFLVKVKEYLEDPTRLLLEI